MAKWNIWLKRWTVPFLWCAGVLIAVAMLLHRMTGSAEFLSKIGTSGTELLQIMENSCYLIAFALSGAAVLVRAIQALFYKTVSIELLVSIAAVGACIIGEFNEAAIVTFLFQLGSFLEQKTMKRTRSAIKSLTEMAPTTAWRIIPSCSGYDFTGNEGEFTTEEIDVDEVEIDDLLLVKTGNQIASDGIITKGEGYVLEASITGEPLPKHKIAGDIIYAGTILDSGTLQMRATKVGEDTTFSRIIALVEEAQDAKSPVERFIDRFARYYTPFVIVIAAFVLLFTGNVDTAITVLVLACPGALVIGAPIANVAGIGRGAKQGVLLKGGDSVHTFSQTDVMVFDKTGTLTMGIPEVIMHKEYKNDPKKAIGLAAAVEKLSDHPLAGALLDYAGDGIWPEAEQVRTHKGCGMEALVDGYRVLVGNRKLMEENGIELTGSMQHDLQELQNGGATEVMISVDDQVEVLLGIADAIKPDAAESMHRLRELGIESLYMLTGDNRGTAQAIADQLNIADYRAEMLPEDKMAFIRGLQEEGRSVTFVGDGINDSPALTAADIGIAMGSGTDVAIEHSDVVLIKSDLSSLADALCLAKRTVRILYENIIIAVGTVVLLLAGLFAGYIHMAAGMLIHEASILLVIFNAMRLLLPGRNGRKE